MERPKNAGIWVRQCHRIHSLHLDGMIYIDVSPGHGASSKKHRLPVHVFFRAVALSNKPGIFPVGKPGKAESGVFDCIFFGLL